MSATLEEKTARINQLNALITEARQRGDNVAQLENDRDELLAELQHVQRLATQGKVLRG